jgi:Domain of unknown function (DUF4432)
VTGETCTAIRGTAAGMETLTLDNGALSLVILVGKGADILAIGDRASGIDPLLRAPWGLRDPRHALPGASELPEWILRYPGGWQAILPNFGPACRHQGIEHPMHGEAAVMPWSAEIAQADAAAVEVVLRVELILSPLVLERRVRLARGARSVTIAERIANAGTLPVEYMWGHHPALGAPFLSPACRIDSGAAALVVDGHYDGQALPLAQGSRHAWHGAGAEAVRQLPAAGEPRDLVAYLLEFEQGWWAVTNTELGVGFGLAWDAAVFPVACLWQELGATTGFPWFGRGYALALEPTTSWPAAGIAEVARTTGTQRSLGPGESVETHLCAVVYDSPWGVAAIARDGSVDVVPKS